MEVRSSRVYNIWPASLEMRCRLREAKTDVGQSCGVNKSPFPHFGVGNFELDLKDGVNVIIGLCRPSIFLPSKFEEMQPEYLSRVASGIRVDFSHLVNHDVAHL